MQVPVRWRLVSSVMNARSEVTPQQGTQKNLLLVHDISGVGRCAALVVLPVLSAAGIHCALLPTMLLSTHTGGFGTVYRRDLSSDMIGMLSHWLALGLRFDAVYIGYVGGIRQLELVEEALSSLLAAGAKLYVDPVMGDGGRAYAFCGEDLRHGFLRLAKQADLIFPNRTEAAMLLDKPLVSGTEPEPVGLESLLELGARQAVITGVREGDNIGVTGQSRNTAPFSVLRPRHPGSFPGTGDLLASAIIAALSRHATLEQACNLACDLLDQSLAHTARFGAQPRFGLAFEAALPAFCQALEGLAC